MQIHPDRLKHEHHFDQHQPKAGESRTWIVAALTFVAMAGEIIAGLLFGSMALLADGLHMASHAAALIISAASYLYARRHAHDKRFSYGTGKVGTLAGYSSAVLLAIFALIMVIESFERFLHPVKIAFNEAILVAFVGLIVNLVSIFILNVKDHSHEHKVGGHDHSQHFDYNLRAAYLHVSADALTSILAIISLFAGKLLGLNWMDPLMGILGAIMVTRWSLALLRETSRILLDRQAPHELLELVRSTLENDGQTQVTDLHIWSIGSSGYAAAIELLSTEIRDTDYYQVLLKSIDVLSHATIAVHVYVDDTVF